MPFYSSSSLSFSNPGIGAEAQEFTSLYEAFNPLTTLAKTHFIEWFSGDALDSIWTTRNLIGTSVFTMVDAIDDGFSITSETTTNEVGAIDFNDIGHYDPRLFEMIFVMKGSHTTNTRISGGLSEDNVYSANFLLAGLRPVDTPTNYSLFSQADATGSTADTGIAMDTNFHVHKLIGTSANIQYEIDGVAGVTKTTDRPDGKSQPAFLCQTVGTAQRILNVRYMEIYST